MKTEREMSIRRESGGEPHIRMFCCQYAGGGAAFDYDEPGDVISEIVPCAGKVDPQRLLKMFEGGADGALIVTCPPDECKMAEGNHRANRRAGYIRGILDEIGIGSERVEIVMPEADAESFETAVDDALARLRSLGPSILNKVSAV